MKPPLSIHPLLSTFLQIQSMRLLRPSMPLRALLMLS
jgi:hypothetical protein